MQQKGTFYSVGTGPGDPSLLTYKAVETINQCQVIAVPDSGGKEQAALQIVEKYLENQHIVSCHMPMTRDQNLLEKSHEKAADDLEVFLQDGQHVAFLTLGDPSIYSTAMYVHKKLAGRGYNTVIIPGIPSFSAVAATLNEALCEGGEMLHVIPASYGEIQEAMALKGNKVLMKSGKSMAHIKELLQGQSAKAVECCGMAGEKVHQSLATLADDSSYFSIVLVKGEKI